MHELPETIPDVEEFLALEPEEIGLKLLFFLRDRPANERDLFYAGNMENELFEARIDRPRYPRERAVVCGLAFREAFAWLEAQGMIVPAEGANGSNGWRVLSRRAETFQNPADFKSFLEGRRLNKELLHPTIGDDVWMSFIRRQYDIAVFQAMKAVEIAVREAAGFDVSQHGVPMVRNAFHKDNGPLRNPDQQEAERGTDAPLRRSNRFLQEPALASGRING